MELLGAWCSRVSLSGGVVFVYLSAFVGGNDQQYVSS